MSPNCSIRNGQQGGIRVADNCIGDRVDRGTVEREDPTSSRRTVVDDPGGIIRVINCPEIINTECGVHVDADCVIRVDIKHRNVSVGRHGIGTSRHATVQFVVVSQAPLVAPDQL